MGSTRKLAGVFFFLGGTLCLVAGLAPAASAQEPTTTTSAPEQAPVASDMFIRGSLSYEEDGDRVPAEDIDITVASADGSFSETVATDDDGDYEVEVPGAGDYRVEIDASSLPTGVDLRSGDEGFRTVSLPEGESRSVLFRLSTGDEDGGSKEFDRFLRLSVQGIRFGLILAMCAVGLSLIFGTTGMVNFAHGEMVTFGALITYWYNQILELPFLLSAFLAVLTGGLVGGALNAGLWRPLRNRGTGLVALIVFTLGLGLGVRYIFQYQYGGAARAYSDYSRQLNPIEIGPVDLPPRDLWIMGMSIVILLGVAFLLQRTRMGKAIRAVSDNKDLAESSGINVERVITWVWISGAGLAATGGIFQALDQQARWDTGYQLLLLMFAAVILGGLGTAYGALVGALVIGVFIQLSTMVVDTEFKTAAALMVMIIVLLIRPQGILGQAERVG